MHIVPKLLLKMSCFVPSSLFLARFRLDGPGKLPSTAWNIALDTCVENGELEKARALLIVFVSRE